MGKSFDIRIGIFIWLGIEMLNPFVDWELKITAPIDGSPTESLTHPIFNNLWNKFFGWIIPFWR
jgi:hypothetical protein